MASRRERIVLEVTDGFTAPIARAAAAADELVKHLALNEATWEPHDWNDF